MPGERFPDNSEHSNTQKSFDELMARAFADQQPEFVTEPGTSLTDEDVHNRFNEITGMNNGVQPQSVGAFEDMPVLGSEEEGITESVVKQYGFIPVNEIREDFMNRDIEFEPVPQGIDPIALLTVVEKQPSGVRSTEKIDQILVNYMHKLKSKIDPPDSSESGSFLTYRLRQLADFRLSLQAVKNSPEVAGKLLKDRVKVTGLTGKVRHGNGGSGAEQLIPDGITIAILPEYPDEVPDSHYTETVPFFIRT